MVRIIALGSASTLLLGVGAVHADRPEGSSADGPVWRAGSPGTFITVAPSNRLVDGQTVEVSGTGFGANNTISLFQCSADVPVCVAAGTTTSAGDGSFGPVSVIVSRVVAGHECRLGRGDCIMEAIDFASLYDGGICCLFANHHLSFQPARPARP
ncbi:MAG TPA: neocarzinostatin apoprotein domain-containing protein [Candidatus Limnocylindria bacterium]|nr:neocarzinostatin apoprotein domain-containing protein [Candidatus Limnocylindria bacterium]